MFSHQREADAFTIGEVARAAGVDTAEVRALLESGAVRSVGQRFVSFAGAVELVRALRAGVGQAGTRRMFALQTSSRRSGGAPLAASSALHGVLLLAMVLATGFGARSEPVEQRAAEPARLVFLATPGPGGGGGGGGLRQPAPPARAELKGSSSLRSPVTVRKRAEPAPPEAEARVEAPAPVPVAEPQPEPAPPPPAPTPPVVAPVVSVPADAADRAGDLAGPATTPSSGPGADGGAGSGEGSGIGGGHVRGIGDGTIAGTGGGPYRPGAGITPPTLEREIKPVYSDEGRRRGVEGDVVMEVVVQSNGRVGNIRVLRGLGSGLDQRAADAVRQWTFSPARRYGTPVDVLVEVAVEFRLR
jgi:TonB family protein